MIFLAYFLFGLLFRYGESGCSPAEWYIDMKCSIKHRELLSQAVTLDFNYDYNMTKINTTCTDFLKCSTKFNCGKDRKNVENIDNSVILCHFVAFIVSPAYLDCIDKLDTKKSKCLLEWDPFPSLKGTDEENTVKQKEKACKNLFGKDDCLEKEILDMCSMDFWKDFRKHYLVLNKIFKACDFD